MLLQKTSQIIFNNFDREIFSRMGNIINLVSKLSKDFEKITKIKIVLLICSIFGSAWFKNKLLLGL